MAPILGLLLVALILHSPLGRTVGTLASFFLIFPHYVSSFSFYLGDENLSHYKLNWPIFFLGPLIILVIVCGLRLSSNGALLGAIIIVWNVFHVSQQSSGILSVYRRLNEGNSQEKAWSARLFLFVNSSMAFWFLERTPVVYDLVNAVHSSAPDLLKFLLAAGVTVNLIGYVYQLQRRESSVKLPELLFLFSSLLMFHPFLWVEDIMLATLAMLIGHVLQYLAFIWLVNRRKYQPLSGSRQQRLLGHLSGNIYYIVLFCLAVGGTLMLLDELTSSTGIVLPYWILVNSLALTHFYVDGLVWAFRNPYVKQSLSPYLFTASR